MPITNIALLHIQLLISLSLMRLICAFFLLVLASISFAQENPDSSTVKVPVDQGYARFLVDVDNGYFEIVIDDTMYLKLYKTALPPGHHKAKIWSPGYVMNVVEFDIEKDKTTDVYVSMALSNDKLAFEEEYKDYRMKFHKSLTVPLSLTLAMGLTSSAYMITAYIMRQRVYEDIDLYFMAPTYSEAVDIKNSIAVNNRKYNTRRIMFYSTLGLTVAGIGATIYTFKRFNKNNSEPQYIEPSPFKDKFSMNVSPFGCSIKWRFG